MPTQLRESRALTAEAVTGQPGRFRIELITPGWGSSGYYSADVLETAGKAGVFPAGLKMYLDHPSYSESMDRPERSVRDVAGALAEAAYWDADAQALVAEADVFSPYRPVLAEMRDAIGVSIRAAATVESGEAEGRQGTIITELVEGISADYVTDAGRGGRIAEVLESARVRRELTREAALAHVREARNIGTWIESRLHLSLTQIADDMFGDGRLTREERIALSGAVGDGLTAFTAALEQAAPQLYARDLWAEPDQMVEAASESVPVIPAGQSISTRESEGGPMPEITVDEAEYRTRTEQASRVPALESERDTAVTERDQARIERDRLRESVDAGRARELATTAAAEAGITLDEYQLAGITADYPRTSEGRIDEDAFTTRVAEAVAKLAEHGGTGKVRGVGESAGSGNGKYISEAEFHQVLGIGSVKGA